MAAKTDRLVSVTNTANGSDEGPQGAQQHFAHAGERLNVFSHSSIVRRRAVVSRSGENLLHARGPAGARRTAGTPRSCHASTKIDIRRADRRPAPVHRHHLEWTIACWKDSQISTPLRSSSARRMGRATQSARMWLEYSGIKTWTRTPRAQRRSGSERTSRGHTPSAESTRSVACLIASMYIPADRVEQIVGQIEGAVTSACSTRAHPDQAAPGWFWDGSDSRSPRNRSLLVLTRPACDARGVSRHFVREWVA